MRRRHSVGAVLASAIVPKHFMLLSLALTALFLAEPVRAENVAPAKRQSAHAADTGALMGTVFESYCDCGRQLTRGASGVTLVLGDAETTVTANDGSYQFGDIVSGTYTVGAFVDGFGEARSETTIALGETSILDLDLPFSVPGEIIIGFIDGTTREDAEALASSYGVTLVSYSAWWALVRIPRGFYTADFIVAFQAESIVRYAERNHYICGAAIIRGVSASAVA